MADLAELQRRVDEVLNHRIAIRTKKVYIGAIRRVLCWMKLNSAQSLIAEYQNMPSEELSKISYDQVKAKPFPFSDSFDIARYLTFLEDLKDKNGQPLQPGSLASHRSGFVHLFALSNRVVPATYTNRLTDFFTSKKKHFAELRRNGLLPSVHEGKKPIPFELFQFLGMSLLASGDKADIVAHLYLTMSWNLICRAGNTATICFSHLEWRSDALGVYFPQQKNDQEGDRPKDPRHVYANPLMPEVCSILSLGIYLLCFTFSEGIVNLFTGNDPYDRYLARLKVIFCRSDVAAELSSKGIEDGDLGTHSTRKGAATYVLSGTTACPSLIPLSLRCGWKLEGVTARYLRYEAAGDQFVGRTVSGLPVSKVEFAILPPFFEQRPANMPEILSVCFPNAPANLSEVLEFCLASVVYHHGFLEKTLPKTHPLFSSRLFRDRNMFESLKEQVSCRVPRHAGDRVKATGLSPTHAVLEALEGLRLAQEANTDLVRNLGKEVVDSLFKKLEERAVGLNQVTHQGMADMMERMLSVMKEQMSTLQHQPQQSDKPPQADQ